MIADTIKFVDGFIGTDRRQFIIPIYQRRYKWTNEQCSRLIDDMLKSASEHVDHFTGAVVYKEKPSGSFKSAFLVDGQQRMTTVILMLKALSLISSKMIQTKSLVFRKFFLLILFLHARWNLKKIYLMHFIT